ncbi:unnamed protein product, partial [Closterium sp. NIES-53]
MASRALVSGLPKSLPLLPPGPAPTCVPCVEGRQRAAPHSSSFPPTEAPLQTLHMDVRGPARVRGQGHEHRGGEFSSDLQRAFCCSEGIRQTFTLPASPQKNGIAERRIGMVMDVARTSMIHAAAPDFLWLFAVLYAAHQINLQPRVSLLETTPTLRWTGKVGDASVFCVWGSRDFVRDASVDKLSSRAVPCVFLRFPPEALEWQFYHPTSRRVLASQDVTSTAASALVAELVDFAASCRLDYAASLVAESASVCPPSVGGECALSTDVLEVLTSALPRSPPVLYVDNKAMLALCREHRLEHRTKHIALRYFLARELQQRGQLRLAYVASEANTADIFTKALAPGDHQRFCTL